jgi:hypothetical protein
MFKAKVVFYGRIPGQREFGRFNPPMSGFHPQLAFGDVQTSCRVESLRDKEEVFDFDVEYEVELIPMIHEADTSAIGVGSTVRLLEGNNLVGNGTIISVEEGAECLKL